MSGYQELAVPTFESYCAQYHLNKGDWLTSRFLPYINENYI
jgi:hypothetical protein